MIQVCVIVDVWIERPPEPLVRRAKRAAAMPKINWDHLSSVKDKRGIDSMSSVDSRTLSWDLCRSKAAEVVDRYRPLVSTHLLEGKNKALLKWLGVVRYNRKNIRTIDITSKAGWPDFHTLLNEDRSQVIEVSITMDNPRIAAKDSQNVSVSFD